MIFLGLSLPTFASDIDQGAVIGAAIGSSAPPGHSKGKKKRWKKHHHHHG